MNYLAVITGLIASASAVDLYLHGYANCDPNQPWSRCQNFNPNRCCGYPGAPPFAGAVAMRGIQPGWNVQIRAYTGGNCANLGPVVGNGGRDHICVRGAYTGIGYNFVGRRSVEPVGNDLECQRTETVGLGDGSEFDLTSLDDEEYMNFIEIAMSGISVEDVPEQFRSLQSN